MIESRKQDDRKTKRKKDIETKRQKDRKAERQKDILNILFFSKSLRKQEASHVDSYVLKDTFLRSVVAPKG